MDERAGTLLIRLARQAIETAFTKRELDLAPYRKEKALAGRLGVFVTLTEEEELRGCIGFIKGEVPLCEGVVHAARAAAFDDPRFPALEPEELGEVRVEVSVLTTPKQLKVRTPEEYLEKVRVGRDGLIIRKGFYSGLLLPQVPVEYGWSVETFLEHLCLKAGLAPKAWKEKGVEIEAFQAEIFSEK